MDDPRPATQASADELLELVQWVRKELVLREEAPSGDWVESSANDLKAGRRPGFYYPPSTGGGIAFYSARGRDAFGHVHTGPGPDSLERGQRLSRALLEALPPSIRSIAVGFTGLPVEEERNLLQGLATRPGSTVIERRAMERALSEGDGRPVGEPPHALRFVPARDVTLDALAELDVQAFAGSDDALLVGSDVADYRRVIETILEGRLGLFVDEASTTLYRPDPPHLVAALLTTEHSARRAVFVDFMVDPAFQRQGIGRFLLRWGLRALWALGYARVQLWVSLDNAPALRLYETNGFRVTATSLIYRWERPSSGPQPQTAR